MGALIADAVSDVFESVVDFFVEGKGVLEGEERGSGVDVNIDIRVAQCVEAKELEVRISTQHHDELVFIVEVLVIHQGPEVGVWRHSDHTSDQGIARNSDRVLAQKLGLIFINFRRPNSPHSQKPVHLSVIVG